MEVTIPALRDSSKDTSENVLSSLLTFLLTSSLPHIYFWFGLFLFFNGLEGHTQWVGWLVFLVLGLGVAPGSAVLLKGPGIKPGSLCILSMPVELALLPLPLHAFHECSAF